MARPRRPETEARAVREASEIVKLETGLTSARAISREIAARVMIELAKQIEGDPLDLAFAAIEGNLIGSPIHRLATCPYINVMSEFVERQLERQRARAGRYPSPAEESSERAAILAEVGDVLASRYDWQLRKR